MAEKKALEKNEVMLWGQKKVNPTLLADYDKGNKHPKSKAKVGKDVVRKTVKKEVDKRVYDSKEKYTIDDIGFLNKEYDRIEEEAVNLTDFSKMDELVELQDKIYETIEKLKKEKEKMDEEDIIEPVKTTGIDFDEINKLVSILDELREKYIESRGDVNIRMKIEEIEAKIDKMGKVKKTSKSGKGVCKTETKCEDIPIKDIDYDFVERIMNIIGRGFKKGSPEAYAHAEKMRQLKLAKNGPPEKKVLITPKQESKARYVKGSEEAKEISRKLVEARKVKAEARKKEAEEVKKKEELKNPPKPKGRPWYYIGDMPKGYREATEVEAIKNGKVSKFGKYEVDDGKYFLWINYQVLLDDRKNINETVWTANGIKRRIIRSLQDIEIYKSKLDNDKYESRSNEFKNKLAIEKEKRKYLQYAYDWYYKRYCQMKDIVYERRKIELPKDDKFAPVKEEVKQEVKKEEPKQEVKKTKIKKEEPKPEPKPEVKKTKIKKEEVPEVDVDLYFKKGDDTISLSTKYFTEKYKIKTEYIEKLHKKGIILAEKYYTPQDYKKYAFHMVGGGVYNKI